MLLVDPPREETREITEKILDRSEFEASKSLWNKLLDKLAEWFDSGDQTEVGPPSGGGWAGPIGNLMLWLLLLVLLAGLVWLIWYLVRNWKPRKKPKKDAAVEVVVDVFRPSKAWLKDAADYEREGRWTDAVVAHYRALVSSLVEHGWVPEVVGLTTGELVADLTASQPARSVAFGEATALFERVWYGGDDATANDVELLKTCSSQVQAEAGAQPAPAQGGLR